VTTDVLIVGAGPAGLAAAIELRRLGVGGVLVVEREEEAGGIPRHSAHTGYGLRDLGRLMTGPAYARHYARAAAGAGAQIRTATTVTGWSQPLTAALTSAAGIETVTARAVLLATGCRERPRSARLVPGDRPAGVMTTGELQQRVYLRGERLPGPALIVGAEHVSFSAMVTLAHAGAEVAALVTEQPRHQSYAAFALAARARWRVPVWTSTTVRWVAGRHGRLEGVELAGPAAGQSRFVPCGTLVFTGDWIPDHELARLAGARLDQRSRGPAVDTALQTSVMQMFAAGNLVHAAETASVAALGGRHAARQIAAALRAREPLATPRVEITVAAPLRWVSPSVVRILGPRPPGGHFLLRSDVFKRGARLVVRQGDRVLGEARARLVPTRPVHLAAGWMTRVEPGEGPVSIAVR
jgi:thioredoxin reductase